MPPPQLEEKATPHMKWETVTPEWWVPRATPPCASMAAAAASRRANACRWSLAEAIDFYDAIEWAAAQPWCNGKVGLSGISYFAINQWFVANLLPPVAEGIHPPGRALPTSTATRCSTGAVERLHDQLGHRAHDAPHHGPRGELNPDGWQTNTPCGIWLHHNLDSGVLRGSQAQWDRITVPMLTVGNWTGFALHLRGNTEAYMRAASKQ